jgi:hypothetical protein
MRISLNAKMSDKMKAMNKRRRESEIKPLTARTRAYMAIVGAAILTPGLIFVIRGGEPVFVTYRAMTVLGPTFVILGALLIVMAILPGTPAGRKQALPLRTENW